MGKTQHILWFISETKSNQFTSGSSDNDEGNPPGSKISSLKIIYIQNVSKKWDDVSFGLPVEKLTFPNSDASLTDVAYKLSY